MMLCKTVFLAAEKQARRILLANRARGSRDINGIVSGASI
jgi:hypothetical protein